MRLTRCRTFAFAFAVLLSFAGTARAAKSSCDDHLPHVLNVGVPRTSLSQQQAEKLPDALAALVSSSYVNPCDAKSIGRNKTLQINLAFGSDYEVLDWLERGSVDAGIVPNLSLWLLEESQTPLKLLNRELSTRIEILRPLTAQPACSRFQNAQWVDCGTSAEAEAEYAALLHDIREGKGAGTRRVMFASHLSSTGFLDPIQKASDVFADRENQWEQLFAASYFTVDSDPQRDAFAMALQEEKNARAMTVIAFPGEEALVRNGARPDPTMPAERVYHEHLVVSMTAADDLFPGIAFVDPKKRPPALAESFASLLRAEHPPRPLEVLANVNPGSGVRNYEFTINEVLRLLQQQQRSSGQDALALVLPGGGVKAAYQSRLVDHLYANRHLRNADLGDRPGSLKVQSVLGTSGGALLGYFVSQLGETGPFDLSNILWRPEQTTLKKEDVFGTTDMLRYFSIAWTLMVFCILLAVMTGMHTSGFYRREPTPNGAWRWRLMTVWFVFIAVPLLIRVTTGGDDIEHVPVVEGFFYSILTIIVMFCDQCLVYSRDERETRLLGLHVAVIAGVGGLLIFASFFGVSPEALETPVSFGVAFLTLSAIFLGGPLLILYASDRLGDLRRRAIDVISSLAVVLALCAFFPRDLSEHVPHMLALLALIGLAVYTFWYAQLPTRKPYVGTVVTFLTLLATAVLCWPSTWPADPSVTYFTVGAFEQTPWASFLASAGALLLVVAAMVWVYQRREYSLHNGSDFSIGLALLVGHAFVTALIVGVITKLARGRVYDVEMTLSFWVAVTIVGALLAVIIVVIAPRKTMLKRAVKFLTEEHPNGALLPRRYARILAIATLSVVWWNAIIAPALYGNNAAQKYLERAVTEFDRAYRKAAQEKNYETAPPRGFIPTAQLVAPTNTLDDHDSTRYFLFQTPKSRDMKLGRRVAGAEWKVYKTTPNASAPSDCTELITPVAPCTKFVQGVVFSSGSPFPIFAAHRMKLPGEKKKLGLIDGGYSNDVPIDAARTIEARQALVVHSSNPFPAEAHQHGAGAEEKRSGALSFGMLVRNAQRLPSFMFEMGQQVDRLSRQNLFVVGLAPKLAPDESWPGLAHFDSMIVEGLLEKAEKNLHERIGFVESWGEPRVRFSQQIVGDAARATASDRS